MGVTVQILDKEQVLRSFRVKDYDELTLDDWKDLTIPKIDEDILEKLKTAKGLKDENEAAHELLKRHTGIPKNLLRKLPPSEYDKLVDTIGSLLAEATQEGAKEHPDYIPAQEIEHGGKVYTVPTDLERETIWHQWEEIDAAADLEHEADVYRHFLSILLIEKGREFDPADVDAKDKAFGSMLMMDVFPLCAFFFGSSERFRIAMDRCSARFVSSMRHRVQQALKISQDVGEGSPPDTD